MKLKTNIKAAGVRFNHNQSTAAKALPVKTNINAAGIKYNHNQTATAQ